MSDKTDTPTETRVYSGSRSALRDKLLEAGHGEEKADAFLDEVAPLTRDNPADIEFGEDVHVTVENRGGKNYVYEQTCLYAINTKTGQRLNYKCGRPVLVSVAGPDDVIDLI